MADEEVSGAFYESLTNWGKLPSGSSTARKAAALRRATVVGGAQTELDAALSRGAVVRFADRFRGQSDTTGIDSTFLMRGSLLNNTTETANTSDLLHLPVDSSFLAVLQLSRQR